MTKLDWDKADRAKPDPGRVSAIPEWEPSPHWKSPARREQEAARRQMEKQEAAERLGLFREAVRIEGAGKRLDGEKAAGAELDVWDEMLLRRWLELRHLLPSSHPND